MFHVTFSIRRSRCSKPTQGTARGASAFDAGKEAAAQAVEGLDAPKVAFVYCSCDYNVTAVVDGVKEAIPGVPVLGNTSFTGVIVSDGGYVGGDEPFVGVMVLSSPEMAVGIAAADRAQNDDPFEAGLIMAEAALDAAGKDVAPDFFYMAASPAEEELYLKGISSVIGACPSSVVRLPITPSPASGSSTIPTRASVTAASSRSSGTLRR